MHAIKSKNGHAIKLGDRVEDKDGYLQGTVIGCPGDGLAWPEGRRHDQVSVQWHGQAPGAADFVRAADLVVISPKTGA